MLNKLNSVNWAEFEHAYGTAEDVPAMIRKLLSEDEEERQIAQEMLYIGPFHQETVTSCLPYVVRFLIELLGNETTPDRAWITEYLAHTANICNKCTEVDLEAIPPHIRASLQAQGKEIDPAAKQLCEELTSNIDVFNRLIEHEANDIRIPALALLVKIDCSDASLLDKIAAMLQKETNSIMRAALGFCLGILSDHADGVYIQYVENMMFSPQEDVFVRLAAGMGLVNGLRQKISEAALENLAQTINDNPRQVVALVKFQQIELAELSRVWPHTRLLDALTLLDARQRLLFIEALKKLQNYAKRNGGTGIGYYQGILNQLNGSSGKYP